MGWQFWIDRGGTFTDIVAQAPDGRITVHKLLSENPQRYPDAALQGIRDILGIGSEQPIPPEQIAAVKMGTTVATNALLEHKGEPTVLVINSGFKDALRIGYQNRPDLFALEIKLPKLLYVDVIEISGRYQANGIELTPLDITQIKQDLQAAYNQGIQACAIVLMHSYRYPQHEKVIAEIAIKIGFQQISVSHEISPLIKLIRRGDTTVVDAYLSPILRRYVDRLGQELPPEKLLFMQSHGGLVSSTQFQGKDSILSGPAGGLVGVVQTGLQAGYQQIIGFDMGGTSTDVCHYSHPAIGNTIPVYERQWETEIAGVRLQTPMLAIHTVAAGGGSILKFEQGRYQVGPESAGANPGPAAYGNNGPLTITDANVLLGKIQPDYFPKLFGPAGNLPLDVATVQSKFEALTESIKTVTQTAITSAEVAAGFITIAVETMAQAIKKISLQRGYDLRHYTLCCFGGAGGQHACLIAESLGMSQVLIHPYAGVLSAYGMGLAEVRAIKEQSVLLTLSPDVELSNILNTITSLETELKLAATQELETEEIKSETITTRTTFQCRYHGSDTSLEIPYEGDLTQISSTFQAAHQRRYGFIFTDRPVEIASLAVEAIGVMSLPSNHLTKPITSEPKPLGTVDLYSKGKWHNAQAWQRETLPPEMIIPGPALIIEPTGTNVIEVGWQAKITSQGNLVLTQQQSAPNLSTVETQKINHTQPDPIQLEIFHNLFQAIAEQMGVTLQNTSASVNIKERLDFSCALFDPQGELVANAPHIPVHLGSMGQTVKTLLETKGLQLQPGQVYASNNPYAGGTHLPDITVITPIFLDQSTPQFFVASRGHHADIGGITPGSMPADSQHIDQEGVLLDFLLLVMDGEFRAQALLNALTNCPYPARNPQQNITDLQAQIAANNWGVQELTKLVDHYGLETVSNYMEFIQANAADCLRQRLKTLSSGQFSYPLDNGAVIAVKITVDHPTETLTIDFTGTSPQDIGNLNAPLAVTKAAVLYVLRTLIQEKIPLNGGCLRPVTVIVPEGCLLNPNYPAAVVAGNVETSQAVTNALYGALGMMAASQGTMNNLTFGNATYQYYETIGGGSGAGPGFHGASGVQTHMTNSRLTDPEVLETRFPVILEAFAIRSDSGGKGQFRGGNGLIRRIKFLETMTVGMISQSRVVAPFGLGGGYTGSVGANWLQQADGTRQWLDGKFSLDIQANDIIEIRTPGGGGYGELMQRTESYLFSETRWTGEFFLPNTYEKRFFGEIHYSPESGITLSYTITGLNVPSQTNILYGVLSSGDRCTLIGQFTPEKYAEWSIKNHGFTTRSGKTRFSFLAIGGFLAEDDKFCLANFSLTNLQEFFFPKGLSDFVKYSDNPIYSLSTLIGEITVRNTAKFGILSDEIDVHIYSSEKPALDDLKEAFTNTLKKYPNAFFMFKKNIDYRLSIKLIPTVTLQQVYEYISNLSDVFSLLMYRPVYPDSIYLTKSDIYQQNEFGQETLLEIYSSMMPNPQTVKLATQDINHQVMPITRKNIPLGSILLNWLNAPRKYSIMASTIQYETGFRDKPTTYGEIILYATQLESISHAANRIKDKYEYPLAKYGCTKLHDGLARILQTSTLSQTAIAIGNIRNEISHVGRPKKWLSTLSHRNLSQVAQYLQLAIIGYILEELGVPKNEIVSYQEKYSR